MGVGVKNLYLRKELSGRWEMGDLRWGMRDGSWGGGGQEMEGGFKGDP